MALLLKAETLKKIYQKQAKENSSDTITTQSEMNKGYITLAQLHYREMPEKMYLSWLKSINEQTGKYNNKKLKESVPVKKK